MKELLEVIPGQQDVSQPMFNSEREYQEFRRSYSEKITPELEDLREARRQSEEQSRFIHCISTTTKRDFFI
jgi:hypothetical protein